MFFSGTFGGETLSLAAAIAVIDKMQRESVIESLWAKGKFLAGEVRKSIEYHGLSDVIFLNGKAPWTILSFTDHPKAEGAAIRTLYMIEMLKNGVLTTGTHNICFAHSDSDFDLVLRAYDRTLACIAKELTTGMLLEHLPSPVIRPVFDVRPAVKS